MSDSANFLFRSGVSTLAVKYATFRGFKRSLFSRIDLHSAVQPPVKALGYQAMTTAFLPLKSSSEYVLPSVPGNENAGALSPTFRSSATAGRPDPIRPKPSVRTPRTLQTERFIATSE